MKSDETLYFTRNGKITDLTEIKNYNKTVKKINIGNETTGIEVSFNEIFTEFKSFEITGDIKYFTVVDGVLFTNDSKTIISYPPKKELTTYTIPSTVETIKSHAFTNTQIQSITIPSSVTLINDTAFKNCQSLTTIIYQGLTTINNCTKNTFEGIRVEKINVPSNYKGEEFCGIEVTGNEMKCGTNCLMKMKNETLYIFGKGIISNLNEIESNKTSIKKIEIGDEITGISVSFNEIFNNLKSFNVSDNNKQFKDSNDILFSKDEKTIISYPPKKELTIYIIPSTVQTIKSSAFYGCLSLTNITIPSSVTSINDKAFKECTSLKTIIYQGITQPNPCSQTAFNQNNNVRVIKEYKDNKFCGLIVTGNEKENNSTTNGTNTNNETSGNSANNNNGSSFIFMLMIIVLLMII